MKRPSLQGLAFALSRTVLNTGYRMMYPFLAVMARGAGADILAMSYTLTARSLLGMVGPLAAASADKRGRKFGMLLGCGLFILGTACVVFFPTLPSLLVAILVSALGKYIFDPSMYARLGDSIPYPQRGRVLALVEFSWSLAFVLGVPLAGFLISRQGWVAPFSLLMILGVIIFLGLAWKMPRDQPVSGNGSAWSGFAVVLGSIPALAGLLLGMSISAANEMVNLIFGIWLEDSFGLQISTLVAASLVIGLSEMAGEGMVAAFVDRLGKPRAIFLGILANCLAALALYTYGSTQTGALIGLFFFYITFEFTLVSTLPLMTEVLPSTRATLMAFNLAAHSLGRALGDLLAPRFYSVGFWLVVVGAVAFNLLALLALQKVKRMG